ncbi:MAG: hypothetical protein RL407_1950 [Bacteroidota bacterium]|jgi:hypothetical protein
MALLNRQSLINYFKKGSAPTERHFADLIESTVNIVDDGISREGENGFRITPVGRSKRLISFFKNFKQVQPEWSINLDQEQAGGLSFQEEEKSPLLVLKNGGNVGIGEENPKSKLDVNGVITAKGRVGSFQVGQVPADGKWYNLLDQLKEPCAFEIMVRVDGEKGSGRYALAHVIALNTFGGPLSRGKITKTATHYGSYFNRLRFRWTGSLYNYSLQVKTARHYGLDPTTGEPYPIKFTVGSLLSL